MVSQPSISHMEPIATIRLGLFVRERRTWSSVQLQESPAHLWWSRIKKADSPLWESTVSWKAALSSPSETQLSSNSLKIQLSTQDFHVSFPGSLTKVTTKICRTTPTDYDDRWYKVEAECIFPFTLDNVTHDQCTLSQLSGFTRPQFICPIRTLRGRGTNYTTADSDNTFCPTHFDSSLHPEFTSDPVLGPNNQWELDPDNRNCIDEDKKFAFATCKNTCPGGETRDC